MNRFLYIGAICLLCLTPMLGALAEESGEATKTDAWITDDTGLAEEPLSVPFGASLAWTHLMGINRDYPFYAWSFAPSIRYRNPHGFAVSMSLPFSVELTDRMGTTYKHEPLLSDLNLAIRGPALYTIPKAGITLGAGMSLSLPTSKVAKYQTKRLGMSFDGYVGKEFYGFSFSYNLKFTKQFHKYTTPQILESGREEVPADVAAAQTAQIGLEVAERSGNLLNTGRTNLSYAFTNILGLSYSITEELALSFNFFINNGKKYEVRGVDGRGPSDFWGSDFGISYTPLKYLSLALGWSNEVPMLNTMSNGYRNPIIYTNGQDDFTLITFSISGQI